MVKLEVFLKAVGVRLVFFLHIGLCTWRLSILKSSKYPDQLVLWPWILFVSAGLLLFTEGAFTLCVNQYGEWRRFIPCIFIYLLGTVPVLFKLEYDLLERRLAFRDKHNMTNCTLYAGHEAEGGMAEDFAHLHLPANTWSLTLQQIMLFLLVAGRWFLPKGKLSREKLSNMLLAYVGMAADILEFLSEGVMTEGVHCERTVIIVILSIWAWSLLQFTMELNLHMTQRKERDFRVRRQNSLIERGRNSEVRGIISVIVMQDGPFLAVRMYLIAMHNIFEQSLIFFTFKNILVIMLQMYRLWILTCVKWDADEGRYSFRLRGSIRKVKLRHKARDTGFNSGTDLRQL